MAIWELGGRSGTHKGVLLPRAPCAATICGFGELGGPSVSSRPFRFKSALHWGGGGRGMDRTVTTVVRTEEQVGICAL